MGPIIRLVVSCTAALWATSHAYATSYTVRNCKVTFSTTGQPVLIKIEGRSEALCTGTVEVEGGTLKEGKFVLDVSKLDTGIPLRNKHLRENYLHVAKYPTATVTITSAADLDSHLAGKAKGKSTFAGMLEMHGTSKPITDGVYEIKGKQLHSAFSVEMADHGVERPSFMGVKIVDKVHINVQFDFDAPNN